eukprot:Skav200578  [mRNA]  locus=scaffold917:289673:295611:- [translate_table: standard]
MPQSLSIHVRLLSGRTASVDLHENSFIYDLRRAAEEELGVGIASLSKTEAPCHVLSGTSTLAEAGVQDGDTVNALVRRPMLTSNIRSPTFVPCQVLIEADGSLLTWGAQTAWQPPCFQQAASSAEGTWAAVREMGDVVTWGERNPCDIRVPRPCTDQLRLDTVGEEICEEICEVNSVQDHLKKVREVVATGHAYAALREDGDVVTWGHIISGGESISIRDKLHAVQHISSSMHAFAAVRRDGSVVTWGEAESGGDSNQVKDQLQRVIGADTAFTAVRADGTVVTWGDETGGSDGCVVTWGDAAAGGDSSNVQDQLHDVRQACGGPLGASRDRICLGCAAVNTIQEELRSPWPSASLRAIGTDLLVSCSRHLRAVRITSLRAYAEAEEKGHIEERQAWKEAQEREAENRRPAGVKEEEEEYSYSEEEAEAPRDDQRQTAAEPAGVAPKRRGAPPPEPPPESEKRRRTSDRGGREGEEPRVVVREALPRAHRPEGKGHRSHDYEHGSASVRSKSDAQFTEEMATEVTEGRPEGAEGPGGEGEDSPWGLYQIDYRPRWAAMNPEPGMVICFNLPDQYIAEEGGPTNEAEPLVEVALVITDKRDMSDGSILLTGRSLGCSDPKFVGKMSGMFNRRTAYVHVCMVEAECAHLNLAVFHLVELWLYSGTTFYRSYVGAAGKKLLKQVLDGIMGEEAAEPKGDGTKAVKTPSTGKGRGGEKKDSKKKEKEAPHREDTHEDKAAALRQRLRKIQEVKDKRKDKSGVIDLDQPLSGVGSEEDSASNSPREPALKRSTQLPRIADFPPIEDESEKVKEKKTGAADPQRGGGGVPARKRAKTVGGQLALNALKEANRQGRDGADQGGDKGGGSPLAFLNAEKKKKKKRKKKKRKKKKGKKKKAAGDPSSSGGSSSSSDGHGSRPSSSSSSSTEGRGYMPPLRRKAQKRPGSVLQLLLRQMQQHLDAIGEDIVEGSELGGTKLLHISTAW